MENIPYPAKKKQPADPLRVQFYQALPPKPYCTNELGSMRILPKHLALRKAYIQPNRITQVYWFVFDLDTSRCPFISGDVDILLYPNLTVINPVNWHSHLFYAVKPPVYTMRQAREGPLRFASDVYRGLRALLGADPGYSGLIAKNPWHPRWVQDVHRDEPWTLKGLRAFIPDRYMKRPRRIREEVGLGRNCILFETARPYAYSEWRRQGFTEVERLFEAVYACAMDINARFDIPLGSREVRGIARSITKWTARHMTKDGFSAIQQARNLRSQEVRKSKAEERAAEVKALYAGGKTQQQIALILGISERQVRSLLKS